MKVHIIGTVNGIENEGMRNIATHLARALEKEHQVRRSGLRQPLRIIRRTADSDVTFLFARANASVYRLARFVRLLCPQVYLVCVQKPEAAFVERNRRRPLRCGWFAISMEDLEDIDAKRKYPLDVGIDTEKFRPVPMAQMAALRETYGFSMDKPLAVHVGHCSKGRGLEDFLALDGSQVQRLVVASGLFEDKETARRLEDGGVTVLRGFQPQIQEIYQMADCCLFPTRSAEYVISIPLSVMEALACGTPVIGYRDFGGLDAIDAVAGAITRVDSAAEAATLLPKMRRQQRTLLASACSWEEAARRMLAAVKEELG